MIEKQIKELIKQVKALRKEVEDLKRHAVMREINDPKAPAPYPNPTFPIFPDRHFPYYFPLPISRLTDGTGDS